MVYGQAGRGPGQKAAEAGAGAGGEVEKGGACLKPTPATILSSGHQQLEGRALAGGGEQSSEFAGTGTCFSFGSSARQLLIRSPQTGRQEINAGL